MSIEFERTIQDVIDFNLFHMKHSPSIKRRMLLMQVSSSLLFILLFFIIFLGSHFINVFTIFVSILAGVLQFVLYPNYNRKSTINGIKKMLSEGNNNALLGHQLVSLSPEGIFLKPDRRVES